METKTKADEWLLSETSSTLDEGETAVAAAYLQSELNSGGGSSIGAGIRAFRVVAGAKAFHALLTDKRVILVACRIGAFSPLLENQGIESIPLTDIKRVELGKSRFTKKFNGKVRLTVASETLALTSHKHNKHLSTTSQFFDRLAEVAEQRNA